MPGGFKSPLEAKLGECDLFLSTEQRESVTSWWLKVRARANTPNWDLVSVVTIDGRQGLVLLEAKAHVAELHIGGKDPGSVENHQQIGAAIREANDALNRILPGWSLSRDSHYQLANRFAWAWKVASVGIPVILVYLGFIGAEEMADRGRPLESHSDWENVVKSHARGIVPDDAWEGRIPVGNASIRPLIRSTEIAIG